MGNKNRILIALITVVTSPVFSQTSGMYPDVAVIASDRNGITFSFTPAYRDDKSISTDHGILTVPQFDYGFASYSGQSGDEDIRVRTVMIAVPGRDQNSIKVMSADYQTIKDYPLAPIPKVTLLDTYGREKAEYVENFHTNDFYPQSVVQMQSVKSMKGWLIGMVRIAPYQYDSRSKTLRKYSRILVRVDFGPPQTQFVTAGTDSWAKTAVLNYSAGSQFIGLSRFRKSTAVNSVLAAGSWYKLEVTNDGMYKIDDSYLKTMGIDRASLSSIYDIKIFGSDGRVIPQSLSVSRPDDLPQIAALYKDNNKNGKFDVDDYILFYGGGVTGWNYNKSSKTYTHYTNPYTNSNYYFLSIGSTAPVKQMSTVSLPPVSGSTISTAVGKVFFDEEKVNFLQSGLNWVSAPFSSGDSRVISNKLNGWISGTSIIYKYYVYSRADVTSSFTIQESDQSIASSVIPGMPDSELNSDQSDYANNSGGQVSITPNLTDSRSNVKFTYNANSNAANGYIDWLELFYTCSLTAVDNEIDFTSPDTDGSVGFSLSSFSSNDVNVFNVSDVGSVAQMTTTTDQLLGSLSFSDTLSAGTPHRYWAGTADRYAYPKSFVKIANSNLHNYPGAEFIIITHNDFKSEANRLKQHKESLPTPISTVVVDVDSLFNEFGIGMPDPSAVRDFIKYAVDHWTIQPKYVLLFGDACFDYKSILGTDKSWVPTVESPESNNKIYTYSYEDFFSYLNPSSPTISSIGLGRLCPRSEDEARVLVDRIIQYESHQTYSQWKNLVTIVADDKWTPDTETEFFHVTQAEDIATTYTPKDFEVKKIYIGDYPTVYAASGRRKPAARQAIIDQVNNGTLILNFTGHGNPTVWAHESILTLDDVKSQFFNIDKLTFIVAATCDWGRFEESGEQSSAEEVVVNKKGGAIGVFSATRAVYASYNFETNKTFYSILFSSNPPMPLGDVTMLTKNILDTTSDLINERKYFLLGDPTLRLAVPARTASIDSINNTPITVVDTLNSLEKVTITSAVLDSSNAIDRSYNGTAIVTVYDAERFKAIDEFPGFTYKQNGSVIYRGENSIANGLFRASFIVPKDISYENKKGRISVYYTNGATDGRGYSTNFIVGGTSSQAGVDTVGPSISIYFDTPSFRSGDVVTDNPMLIVDLKDSSGINSSGSGIGHRIEAWLDGSNKSIDLTDYYKGNVDSYQEGTATYPFTNLSEGDHSIRIRGWDVYNNSAVAEAAFMVSSGEALTIRQVYNFPNPVTTSTTFTFQLNQLTTVDAEIKIYTVTGRLIQTLKNYGISDRFVTVNWDRRDADGDEVGNGIYFYTVTARTIDGQYSSVATGKLAVVR